MTKTKPEAQALVAITDEVALERIKKYYEVGGGSKFAVFRSFFVEGYKDGAVFKALAGKKGFENLIRQHVNNEFKRWSSKPKG